LIRLFICLAVALGSAASSAASQTRSVSDTDLAYFIGEWEGTVHFPQDSVVNHAPPRFVWTVSIILDDHWLEGTVDIEGERFTKEFLGVDPATGELLRFVVVADGSTLRFRSHGWDQDTLIWLGSMNQDGVAFELREDIQRKGDDAFDAVFFRRVDGEWQRMQSEMLKRKQERGP